MIDTIMVYPTFEKNRDGVDNSIKYQDEKSKVKGYNVEEGKPLIESFQSRLISSQSNTILID